MSKTSKRKHSPASSGTSLQVSVEDKALEVFVDPGRCSYAEWITGERADVAIYRDQDTGKLIGVRLPVEYKRAVITDAWGRDVILDADSEDDALNETSAMRTRVTEIIASLRASAKEFAAANDHEASEAMALYADEIAAAIAAATP